MFLPSGLIAGGGPSSISGNIGGAPPVYNGGSVCSSPLCPFSVSPVGSFGVFSVSAVGVFSLYPDSAVGASGWVFVLYPVSAVGASS